MRWKTSTTLVTDSTLCLSSARRKRCSRKPLKRSMERATGSGASLTEFRKRTKLRATPFLKPQLHEPRRLTHELGNSSSPLQNPGKAALAVEANLRYPQGGRRDRKSVV